MMPNKPHIRIVDLPCGYGKSSRIERSFKKSEKYIAVVPYLTEVERFIAGAKTHSDFNLTQPESGHDNKRDHCEKLIRRGKSVACTHALFYRLGTLATMKTGVVKCTGLNGIQAPDFKVEHLLDDYNLIIDEVVDPFQVDQTVRTADFDEDYLKEGLAEELEDGQIVPTTRWDKKYEQGSKTYNRELYEKAKSGGLYRMDEKLFVLTVPIELFLRPKTITIYTYLSEGSLLLKFLQKLEATWPEAFTMKVDTLPATHEVAWREDVAKALTVLTIPGLEDQKWNHTAQLRTTKTHAECASLGHELRKFKEQELYAINLNTVMLTCARALWHGNKTGQKPLAGRLAKHTRLFGHAQKSQVFDEVSRTYVDKWSTAGVSFVPNTTRGTNDHAGCTKAIYLYDQNPNPQLLTFLGLERSSLEAKRFCDAYALTELVQWLFRSAIRVGGVNGTNRPYEPRRKVTLYMPSERMRNLLLNWLLTGRVCSGEVEAQGSRQQQLLDHMTGQYMANAA